MVSAILCVTEESQEGCIQMASLSFILVNERYRPLRLMLFIYRNLNHFQNVGAGLGVNQ
jgi:hypothetical protein